MKNFTQPDGLFSIRIPLKWQYANVAVGIAESSPYSFQHYENPSSAFQISCYPKSAHWSNKVPSQPANTDHLHFTQERMDDDKFHMRLWFANVEDHYFMIKFIYDANKEDHPEILEELQHIETSLATLQLLGGEERLRAVEFDVYEKFIASLAASFDLRNKAIEHGCLIELVIVIANQIDAYLRMCLVLHKQLEQKNERIEVALLRQGPGDRRFMEKEIYHMAADLEIIDQQLLGNLVDLYEERNKVVHRYIISELRTRDLGQIAYEYFRLCDQVILRLKHFEDLQAQEKTGIYADRNPDRIPDELALNILWSQINDKHLDKNLFRKFTDV